MLVGPLMLALLTPPAHAECGTTLDDLTAWLETWSADAARGIHTVSTVRNVLARPPERTATGPHMGASLDIGARTARLAGQPIGTLNGSPMGQTRLIQALQADANLSIGLTRGDPDFRHVLIAMHPDGTWGGFVSAARAAYTLGIKSVSLVYAAPDLAPPPPSDAHDWFETLYGQGNAARTEGYTHEITAEVADCPQIGKVFEDAAKLDTDHRPAEFHAKLPNAFRSCACKAEPAHMAELLWNMDGRDRSWLRDVELNPSAIPVSLLPTLPWTEAEPSLWAAAQSGAIWPGNQAATASEAPSAP